MSCFLYVTDEESNQKLNLDDLYEKKQKRNLKQLSIFNKILKRIHTRIQLTGKNKSNEQHIWFTVPEYLFGEPVYNQGECISYLFTKLEDNGFHVKYMNPNSMFISWSHWVPNYVRTEFKKKTGKIMDPFGNITDPLVEKGNPDENDINKGILNDRSTANSNNSILKKDSKYMTIDKYKPTGKFVYNPDILEKIEKKVSF